MFGGIDAILAAGERRDRPGTGTGAVSRCVDAARQARHGDELGLAQFARDVACEFRAGRGGVARADDRHHRQFQNLDPAAYRDQRRRIVDHPQSRRIVRLAEPDEHSALPLGSFDFPLSFRYRIDAAGRLRATASCQRRKQLDCGLCATVMVDQSAKRPRADILAADEA